MDRLGAPKLDWMYSINLLSGRVHAAAPTQSQVVPNRPLDKLRLAPIDTRLAPWIYSSTAGKQRCLENRADGPVAQLVRAQS